MRLQLPSFARSAARPPFGAVLTIAVVAALLAACSKTAPAGEDIRPVRAQVIAPAQASVVAELAGDVRPRIESRVGFQVGGRIVTRVVDVGQSVQAGQVLATIDPADFKLAAAAARAQLAAAQVDRDQQRIDYKRFEELQYKGFISSADLERRKAALDAAEARHAQAAAQATVSGNQAAYATLRAPSAGVVAGLDAEVGQVVAAGQSVVRIARTGQGGEKEVAVAIPESRLEQLRALPDVRVTLWANGAQVRGRVREISPVADAATRTYPARVTLLDPPPTTALGMTATVVFETPIGMPVITLPLQALLREGDATFVWKLDRAASTVRKVKVEIASITGNELIIAGGVAPGDTVVTAGVHLLKEGQKVRLLDAPASSPPVPAAASSNPAPSAPKPAAKPTQE